ncbi:hypothetical protein D3870_18215 [Noviherbaspirillum cavernae]|uniref:Uncharacterized protein n=1 Tax=Noviherbaspirillum cavernae TaxID=2320862 RepID=A0A418X5M8_9BURK|nr:hypothetical protein [Noviherbaspirillum cavernae]RJG07671.1 hypothetical protein D3870_18215 [Noviherbaspirillum cavernae]
MKSSFLKFPALLAASSAILLSACGGGGGGDAPAASSSQQASTITVANANDVAAQTYAASNSLNDQVSGSAGMVIGVSVETHSTGLLNAAMQQLYRALDAKPAAMAVGVEATNTINCSGGGTLSFAYKVTDTATITSGDTVAISASNCVEDGARLNGGLTITFASASGTPSPSSAWSAAMTMKFANLAITGNGVTDTANGDITLSYSRTAAGAETFSATGASLQTGTTKSSGTASRTMSNYEYSGDVTPADLYTYRDNFTITGNLPRLGSNVTYTVKTLTDFKQLGNAYPHQGAMIVTASDKTSLTFTVLNNTSVQIGVDKNGDGTVDDTMTKSWSEFSSLF